MTCGLVLLYPYMNGELVNLCSGYNMQWGSAVQNTHTHFFALAIDIRIQN